MPKPKEAIAAELAAAGCKAIRESHVAELSRLLLDDERIVDSLMRVEACGSPRILHLIVTNQRVALFKETLRTNWRGAYTGESQVSAEYILWKNIARVRLEHDNEYRDFEIVVEGLTERLGSLRLDRGGTGQQKDQFGISPVSAIEVQMFGERIRDRLDRYQEHRLSASRSGDEFMDRLERLARLRESGALDEEEFRAAKRNLLLD